MNRSALVFVLMLLVVLPGCGYQFSVEGPGPRIGGGPDLQKEGPLVRLVIRDLLNRTFQSNPGICVYQIHTGAICRQQRGASRGGRRASRLRHDGRDRLGDDPVTHVFGRSDARTSRERGRANHGGPSTDGQESLDGNGQGYRRIFCESCAPTSKPARIKFSLTGSCKTGPLEQAARTLRKCWPQPSGREGPGGLLSGSNSVPFFRGFLSLWERARVRGRGLG